MRKTLALLLLGALVMAAPAFAQEDVTTTVGGSFEVKAESTVDDGNFEKPDTTFSVDMSSKVGLTIGAAKGDEWSLDATLVTGNELKPFGKATFSTPAVTVTAVKDLDSAFILSKVADPLDILVINDPSAFDGANATVLRIESSALGPSILAQWDTEDKFSASVSYSAAPVTVGALVRPDIENLDEVSYRLAGYVTADLGIATISGAAGINTAADEDNTAYGVTAKMTPLEGATVSAGYKVANVNSGASFGANRTVIDLAASATLLDPLSLEAKYSRTTYTQANTYTVYGGPQDDPTKTDEPLDGTGVQVNTKDSVTAGDLRAESISLTAKYAVEPVEASLTFSTGRNLNSEKASVKATEKPLTSIAGSVKFALLPEVATVSVDVLHESDEDRDIAAFAEGVATKDLLSVDASKPFDPNATTTLEDLGGDTYKPYRDRHKFWAGSHLKIGGSVEYKLSEAVTVKPSFAYHTYEDLELAYQVLDPDRGYRNASEPEPQVLADGRISALELGATVAYKLSDAASLNFSVSRTAYTLPEVTSLDVDNAGKKLPSSVEKLTVAVSTSVSF